MTTQTDARPEQIEGLGDDQPGSWIDSIDDLLIRYESRTVHDVLRRINKDRFIMDPDFQRDFIWDEKKQSKLIESVLMRVPLPVFYLAEDDQGRMVVVDGLQRLSTFRRFVNNELRLRLPDRQELYRKKFQDLSPKLQNRVEDCNLILYVLDARVSENARLDIFDRVNAGAPLSRQQMRNCLYMGEATRFLKEESKTGLFLRATGASLDTRTMRDREFVNRFCAFQILGIDKYKDMDEFLAQSLKRMNAETESLAQLSSQFRTALNNNFLLFDKHAFRKHERDQERRGVLNASLWDVMSTGLSRYSEDVVQERSDALKTAFYGLLQDAKFIAAITYSPNSVSQVRHRFEAAKAMFEEVFDACPA